MKARGVTWRILLLGCFILHLPTFAQQSYQEKREKMVRQQIRNRGVKDTSTLKAMKTVPRHLFVPKVYRDYAYADRPLPIGYGQTISQPFMVGYMTAIIDPKPEFKVLEIGTGSGYQAAILGEIVEDVFTIEIIEKLGQSASKRLKELGYTNIEVKIADGYYGWKDQAPFDAIIVTAAAEYVPPPLINQLKEGGKMVIPIGSPFQTQILMLVTKKKGKTTTQSLFPVRFVPFTRSK